MKFSNNTISFKNKVIAIVDDNAEFCVLLQRYLGSVGFDTFVFCNAADFLCQSSAQFDAIVLDLFMPDPDGISVLRHLAKDHFQGAVVLISGEDEAVLRSAIELSKAQQLKHVVSLKKPFVLKMLERLLEQVLAVRVAKDPLPISSWQPEQPDLLQAIKQNQLCLYFQPKIDLQGNKLIGFEALLRWQHPDIGLIMPDRFIPVAEQCISTMNALTSEVIRLAVSQLSIWQQQGKQTCVSINISMLNLVSLDFPDWLQQQMIQHSLLPEQLRLEVTESALMNDISSSLDILLRLKMKGFALSIDDFGTGYSSLVQLHRVPFDELKIDKSFVLTMLKSQQSRTIVETCIVLGKKLGLKVIAEGVEDEQTCAELTRMGCDSAQGYFWSRPLPAFEASGWFNETAIMRSIR